jgi:anti-sigma28 factor (negative regulator of flagellin synthesis)
MFEVSPLSSQPGKSLMQAYRQAANAQPAPPRSDLASHDSLELSGAARRYESEAEAPHSLDERVADLRARIAAGSYLTDDKLDYVVDRLHAELFGAVQDVA